MYKNPYQIFNVDPLMSEKELKRIITDYKDKFSKLKLLYGSYFFDVSAVRMKYNSNQMIEFLLGKRYKYGLDLSKTYLEDYELEDFLTNAQCFRGEDDNVDPALKSVLKHDAGSRQEMHTISTFVVADFERKASKALETYEKTKDPSLMMDLLLEIKLADKKAEIAEELAKRFSESSIICSDSDFSEALMQSASYLQILQIYDQIKTKDKRDEFIPEIYVMKHMSDSSQLEVISPENVQRLLDNEDAYISEYFDNITSRWREKKDVTPIKMENPNHDYAWGIVLKEPQILMKDESVNTPVFKGKITVEDLGSFTEETLFRKRKYFREHDLGIAKKAKPPKEKKGLFHRLTMKQSRQPEEERRTMREYFYVHEAAKIMHDSIWRVTKTDIDGKMRTSIIFTPVSYSGMRGSELFDFIKNIYLSDYMLNMAEQNGGYAGRIEKSDDGFSVSNKYNYEEIASAILFQNDRAGTILDCRDGDRKQKLPNARKSDFLNLIEPPKRRREERIYE